MDIVHFNAAFEIDDCGVRIPRGSLISIDPNHSLFAASPNVVLLDQAVSAQMQDVIGAVLPAARVIGTNDDRRRGIRGRCLNSQLSNRITNTQYACRDKERGQ